jgi:hypothetical protein
VHQEDNNLLFQLAQVEKVGKLLQKHKKSESWQAMSKF